jgi:hypothetical protein
MAPGASRTVSSPGKGSAILGPAKWARCWSAWSGAWRDTFAGAASSGPLRTRRRRTGRATPKGTWPHRRSMARRRRPGPSG